MFLTAAGSVAGCVAMLRQGTKQGSPRNNIQCWTWRSLLRGCTSARSVGAASGNGSGLQPQAVRRSRMDGACPRSYGAPQLVLTARCAPTCIVTKALLHVDSCLTAFFKPGTRRQTWCRGQCRGKANCEETKDDTGADGDPFRSGGQQRGMAEHRRWARRLVR